MALSPDQKLSALRLMLTFRSTNGRRRRLARPRFPRNIELAYFGAIRSVLLEAKRIVDARIVPRLASLFPVHVDAQVIDAPKDVSNVVRAALDEFKAGLRGDRLQRLAARYAEVTDDFQKDQLRDQLRAGLAIDIPLGDTPRIREIKEQFAVENDAYIRSIPEKYFGEVEKTVYQAISTGKRHEEIAQELIANLDGRFEVAESSAKLVARDQVGKLLGAATEARQSALGIESYIWRGVMDSRERDEHVAREGKVFRWDDPPEDGHPGQPIGCRCTAEPNFKEVLNNL